MVDTNCDDKIDLTEFLSLIDRLVEDVLPDAIFEYMGLQRHQTLGDTTGALASGGGAPEGLQSSLLIFWGVILKVMTILTMFLFVFVSLNAFHVDVGEKAASAGSSSIRAALAGLALLGLRSDMSPEYMEKQANIAKDGKNRSAWHCLGTRRWFGREPAVSTSVPSFWPTKSHPTWSPEVWRFMTPDFRNE
eukprot:g22310.t1